MYRHLFSHHHHFSRQRKVPQFYSVLSKIYLAVYYILVLYMCQVRKSCDYLMKLGIQFGVKMIVKTLFHGTYLNLGAKSLLCLATSTIVSNFNPNLSLISRQSDQILTIQTDPNCWAVKIDATRRVLQVPTTNCTTLSTFILGPMHLDSDFIHRKSFRVYYIHIGYIYTQSEGKWSHKLVKYIGAQVWKMTVSATIALAAQYDSLRFSYSIKNIGKIKLAGSCSPE